MGTPEAALPSRRSVLGLQTRSPNSFPGNAHTGLHVAARPRLTGQVCVVHQELQPLGRIPQLPPEFEHSDVAGFLEECDEGHQLLGVGRDLADFLCDAAVLVADAAEQKPAISTTALHQPSYKTRGAKQTGFLSGD